MVLPKVPKTVLLAFTLPEVLIVTTIIAVLSTVVVATYPASQKRARDTQRKSDLKQYQTALEVYYNNRSQYINVSASIDSLCAQLSLVSCPDDTRNPGNYHYVGSLTAYRLWTELEYTPPPGTTQYFVIFSDGRTCTNTVNDACP